MLEQVTPLLITFDEAPNIARTLAKLSWAKRIVVVDSGSTDGTLAIVGRCPQAELHSRPFDSFARQCNFGLDVIGGGWVLSLDADYVLSDALVAEVSALSGKKHVSGYRARFVYMVHGRKLRGSLYPPRIILYQTERGRYEDEGHGHRLRIDGPVVPLASPVFHDDRKPLARWLLSQQNYARTEASHLLETPRERLSRRDRLRLLAWPAPMLVFAYALIAKGCLFDGWPGWFYALQRLLAETMLALEIIERRAARQTSRTAA